MSKSLYDDSHHSFRRLIRDYLNVRVAPFFAEWEKASLVPREVFADLAELGVLGMQVPERFGGSGQGSFLYNVIWVEESTRALVNVGGMNVHLNVVLPYFLHETNDEQKERWLPRMAAGECMTAIAMTEPGTGSDLAGITTSAVRDGDDYILNGSKTFITGAVNAGAVIVVARTGSGENRRDGLSLLVVESGMKGFEVEKPFEKVGLKAQDTAGLAFDSVRVPRANLLGEEGGGFALLVRNLPQERLGIAVGSQAAAEVALETTIEYVRTRTAFGTTVASFQNTKFELAACAVDVAAGRALLDQAIEAHESGGLTAVEAAKVKIFCTEMQARVVDRCLQLHGGYGYIRESPIARLYEDARVTRIYGGTTEVLKTVVAKSLGL